jgi:menaquinone-specific isochorismate synthase
VQEHCQAILSHFAAGREAFVSAIPALHVKTVELHLPADFKLSQHLPKQGMAFIRDGEGLVGLGNRLVLSTIGEDRMEQLGQQWEQVIAAATVTDPTPGPGRGLIAFGSISFDQTSKVASTLTVPHQVLGVKDGRTWLTTIEVSDFTAPTDLAAEWLASDSQELENAYPVATVNLESGSQSANLFEASVDSALASIDAGLVKKVVLARDLKAAVGVDFDPRYAIERLAQRYPSCWTYWVNGLFGASPELLVRVYHKQVSARVLAGTAARGTDPGIDRAIATALTNSAKNRYEHSLAVQSLIQALEPFCVELDSDEEPFSLALPNLWHLASDVQGMLHQNHSVLDLAKALHPTAAVAGTPTREAQALIRQLEPFDRGGYSGPVGWIGADGDGEWAIALRGAHLANGTLTAFAGCGIVEGSSAAAELAETELKFRPITQALASN